MSESKASARRVGPVSPGRLVVIYDDRCDFCCRCRVWLERQQQYAPIEFLEGADARVHPSYAHLFEGNELVVLGDGGEVWKGAEALVVCLWATVRYRPLSLRLGGRSLSTVSKALYRLISENRYRF